MSPAMFAKPIVCTCCSRERFAAREDYLVPPHVTDPRARSIIASVMLATGIKSRFLFSSNRTKMVSLMRGVIASRLHLELDYTPLAIGEMLDRERTSVIYMIKKTRRIVEDRGAP